MTTISSTFSAVGASSALSLPRRIPLTLAITGTFVANVWLQRRVGLTNWVNLKRYKAAATDTMDFTEDGVYRLLCSEYTSGTVTYSLADVTAPLTEPLPSTVPGVSYPILGVSKNLRLTGIEDTITAAAGGTQAGALALSPTCTVHRVTTVGSAADSVKLPPAVVGEVHVVINSAASNSMQVFGDGTDTINDVATATGVAQAAGKHALYVCVSAGKWYRILSA